MSSLLCRQQCILSVLDHVVGDPSRDHDAHRSHEPSPRDGQLLTAAFRSALPALAIVVSYLLVRITFPAPGGDWSDYLAGLEVLAISGMLTLLWTTRGSLVGACLLMFAGQTRMRVSRSLIAAYPGPSNPVFFEVLRTLDGDHETWPVYAQTVRAWCAHERLSQARRAV